jgi:hypothetical protein
VLGGAAINPCVLDAATINAAEFDYARNRTAADARRATANDALGLALVRMLPA